MSALIPINDIEVKFEVVGEVVYTTSLQIAEVFEKRHDSVLKAISNLPNDEFKALNFIEATYTDKIGRSLKCYNLTRDGFSLLVMGFTGEKAYKWKVEFIRAFNAMESELRRLKFRAYTDEISNLKAINLSKSRHHTNVINGYKSQIVQKNSEISRLKSELDRYGELVEAQIIDKPKSDKEHRTMVYLNNIRYNLDEIYAKLGAVMSYVYEDDEFFVNKHFTHK